jgi:hypothetical protein
MLWWLTAAPGVYFIHKLCQPTYRAETLLLIEPNEPDLFGPTLLNHESSQDPPVFLRDQVAALKAPSVMKRTIIAPQILNLRMIQQSADPIEELRRRLDVQIIPGTHWISVAIESPNAAESATIVNEVVVAYRNHFQELAGGKHGALIRDLDSQIRKFDDQIEEKRKAILELAGGETPSSPKSEAAGKNEESVETAPGKTETRWPSLAAEIKAGFLIDEVKRMIERREPILRKLMQLQFDRDQSNIPIVRCEPASPPTEYFSNRGPTYIAILSIGVLLVLVAGSLLLPIANRVRHGTRRNDGT